MLGKSIRQLNETFVTKKGRTNNRYTLPAGAAHILTTDPRDLHDKLALELAAAEALQIKAQIEAINTTLALPPIVDFIERDCINPLSVNIVTGDYSKAQAIRLASHQKRILNHVLTPDPATGKFPYRTVVYSAPKKSGKTAVSWFVASYFARYVESPTDIMVLGNKQDQASDRALAGMLPTLKRLGGMPVKNKITMPNGSVVRALPNEASGEAGGSYSLTLWTELWGFTTDRDRKLWAEMMPVNTRRYSMRWVETYAGYEDSSDLLLSLFLSVFTDVSESKLQPEARPVAGLEDISTTDAHGNVIPCCYEVPSKGLFYYVDHEHRMEWQTGANAKEYYEEVTLGLTHTDIVRLVHNRWQATQNSFATDGEVQGAFARGLDLPAARRGVYAIDASKTSAGTALVGVYDDLHLERTRTHYARVWYPQNGEIDLEATVIAEVLRLFRAGLIERRDTESLDNREKKIVEKEGCLPIEVHYDGYQMAQVAVNLRKNHKLMMREFTQTTERDKADTALQKLYQAGKIDNPDTPDFRDHIAAAKAEVLPDRTGDTTKVRIVRGQGQHAKPNDMIVAQSMAAYRLSQRPRKQMGLGLGQAVVNGW